MKSKPKINFEIGCLVLILGIYIGACIGLLPYFYTIIDPDDTSYLTIADHYAIGDFSRAINGMWSPLNSWIGASLYFTKIPPILLFKYINIGVGVLSILVFNQLIKKAQLKYPYNIITHLIALPFWIAATYGELCSDFLQLMIMLLYLNLIGAKNYKIKSYFPFAAGLLAIVAFYSKFYNFQFFILHFSVANFFIFYDWENKKLSPSYKKYVLIAISLLIIGVLPWVFLMHQKYGKWMLNYTGIMNLTQNIDYAYYRTQFSYFIPPAPSPSCSWWEDPFWIQSRYWTPFTNLHCFEVQNYRMFKAVISFFKILNEFSGFCLAIWSYSIYQFFKSEYKKNNFITHAFLVFLLLPSGYFLFHFEARYIWIIGLLTIILGVCFLINFIFPIIKNKFLKILMLGVLALSFSVQPIDDLMKNLNRDKEAYKWGTQLKNLQLKGNFVADHPDQNKMRRVAYLSYGLNLFTYNTNKVDSNLIYEDMKKNKIKYYLQFNNGLNLLTTFQIGKLKELKCPIIEGLKIYQFE